MLSKTNLVITGNYLVDLNRLEINSSGKNTALVKDDLNKLY